ncbi:hypothetical protein RHD99_10975 [Buttiauxella selenatireducens]|uniref:Uncharacterized protein n=1 Tax=Buttiauxella selenatireducens TaxID=3073902 RepID=A0ABY9SFZ0_9ENTR|nr:hypothetical protein [Buttiauxella sp. R73]WMY76405.1 hypothetical protein RHD99_10975 [Buttiauxella sp. R73]
MEDKYDDTPPELQAGATVVLDDGCDWTAWHVWDMRSRLRVSKGINEQPPARHLVAKPTIKLNVTKRKKK